MTMRRREPVPVFLSIDVEPDLLQISREREVDWLGYAVTYEFVQALRSELEQVCPAKPVFGWYFRTDPQIEQACGSADFAMRAFPDRFDALREKGDYFGVHAHPLRWSGAHEAWVHDFADTEWLRFSTKFALEAFAEFAAAPARLFRCGAGFLSDDVVDVIDREGVEAETGLEPVAGWGLRSTAVPGALDKSPIVGEYTNCASAPKTPYHPSYDDFRRPENGDARRILMVPMTTGPGVLPPRGLLPRLKRRWVGEIESSDEVRMLYPVEDDWTERGFWDLIAHRVDSMERPYVSLAIRTDRLDSFRARRVCRVFHELVRHPLAKRLRFVHPLDVKDAIMPRASPEAAYRTASRIPRGAAPGFVRRERRAAAHAAAGGRNTGR